ncbi:MAG: hypothetical protein GXP09_03880 [Gammaproteobacteria bacterium]|nr:hypothetical protein [Gammaproteobacteria bacterium]
MEDKGLVKVRQITREKRHEKVYNLAVANTHTFYVGEEGVLVHNASAGCDDCASQLGNLKARYDFLMEAEDIRDFLGEARRYNWKRRQFQKQCKKFGFSPPPHITIPGDAGNLL